MCQSDYGDPHPRVEGRSGTSESLPPHPCLTSDWDCVWWSTPEHDTSLTSPSKGGTRVTVVSNLISFHDYSGLRAQEQIRTIITHLQLEVEDWPRDGLGPPYITRLIRTERGEVIQNDDGPSPPPLPNRWTTRLHCDWIISQPRTDWGKSVPYFLVGRRVRRLW